MSKGGDAVYVQYRASQQIPQLSVTEQKNLAGKKPVKIIARWKYKEFVWK